MRCRAEPGTCRIASLVALIGLLWVLLLLLDACQRTPERLSYQTHQRSRRRVSSTSVIYSDCPRHIASEVTSRRLTRAIILPLEMIDVVFLRVGRIELAVIMLFLFQSVRVILALENFDKVGAAVRTFHAMLSPVPLVLALMAVDDFALVAAAVLLHDKIARCDMGGMQMSDWSSCSHGRALVQKKLDLPIFPLPVATGYQGIEI